jgi:hypothetical protein
MTGIVFQFRKQDGSTNWRASSTVEFSPQISRYFLNPTL